MNFAASELIDIFFKEQFRGLEENPQSVFRHSAHRELSIHTILLSSTAKGARDEGLLHLVLMPADLHKSKEQQAERMKDLLSRGDALSLLLAASLARDMEDSPEEFRLLKAAQDKGSCIASMQLGAKAIALGDSSNAMRCYRHSAQLGNPIAQHKLGFFHEQPGPFHDLTAASRNYLAAGLNGHPDALYNLSLLVESGQVSCPVDWTVERLSRKAKALGSPSAKAAFVQASIGVIDTLTVDQLGHVLDMAWEAYIEAPAVGNHSFLLGALYVPTAVRGDVPRSFDIAKAIHFLKIAKRVDPNDNRDSLLGNILLSCPEPPPESSPTIATLTQQAEGRVLDFKIQQLKTAVTEWTKEPVSPKLMAYCNASMMGGAGSPTNAVVFASLLSTSLDRSTGESSPPSSLAEALRDDKPAEKGKGAPHLVGMKPEEVLHLIAAFHEKRIEWGFPTDPTDFPFQLPNINGPFSTETICVLRNTITDLTMPGNLSSLSHVISTMQPHGALIALYLLEIQFFAKELNDWADGFPLLDQSVKTATHPALIPTCLDVFCSPHVEVDVANACSHLLTSCRDQCDDSGCNFSVEDFEERGSAAVLSLLQRGTPCALPIELLVSCVRLLGGMTYTKELCVSLSKEFSEIKGILHDATDSSSEVCHPDFIESTFLSLQALSMCRRVIDEVIGIESSVSTLGLGKIELRSAFQKGSAPKTCALNDCLASAKLKLCSRCGVVGYCSVEHQKKDWRKHKLYCNEK